MKIGDKIKYFRVNKRLTQEELAEGICSKTYLSKIENNVAEPHQEIINFLFERLGINSLEKDPEIIEELNRKIYEWFEVIKSRDKDKAIELEKSISRDISKIEVPIILIQFRLFSIRYHLLLRNLNESKKIIQELELIENNLTDNQKYYFYYFYGLYKYMQNEFVESLEYYSKAEKINQLTHFNEPELIYLITLVHSRLFHVTLAVHYANLALNIFNQNMDYSRSIETQSILAINYIRILEYDKAKHHLLNSLKMAERLNDTYLISNIYHNIGYLYSKINKHDLAIDYYHKNLELVKDNFERYTNTIYYLAESYFAINNIAEANEWLEKGIKITQKHEIINNQIKLYLLQLEHNIDLDQSLKFIEETAICYLQKKKNWKELSEAAEKLADYYANQRYYKKSYYYCCLANNSRKKIQM